MSTYRRSLSQSIQATRFCLLCSATTFSRKQQGNATHYAHATSLEKMTLMLLIWQYTTVAWMCAASLRNLCMVGYSPSSNCLLKKQNTSCSLMETKPTDAGLLASFYSIVTAASTHGTACLSMFTIEAPQLEMHIPLDINFSKNDVSAGILPPTDLVVGLS